MRDLPGWWPLLAALGVAVALIAVGYYSAKRRREAYGVFAACEYSYPVGKSRRSFRMMHWEGEEALDEAAIRALFTPAVRQVFAHNRGHHVAGAGHHLFWWRLGTLPKPDELDAFLTEGDGIRRALVRS